MEFDGMSRENRVNSIKDRHHSIKQGLIQSKNQNDCSMAMIIDDHYVVMVKDDCNNP